MGASQGRMLRAILQFVEDTDHMETITITITGMNNEDDVRTVANAIQDLPHIGQLDISVERGQATIEFGRFISVEDILRAIEDSGFGATEP